MKGSIKLFSVKGIEMKVHLTFHPYPDLGGLARRRTRLTGA